jgi:hypothetical protein
VDIEDDAVAVELNEMETRLLCYGLIDWGGPSRCPEAMARALGFKDVDDLQVEGDRIAHDIGAGRPLTRRDWSRALLSAEVTFGNDLIGTGSEWTVIQGGSDAEWLATLRRLRRKLPASRRHLPR